MFTITATATATDQSDIIYIHNERYAETTSKGREYQTGIQLLDWRAAESSGRRKHPMRFLNPCNRVAKHEGVVNKNTTDISWNDGLEVLASSLPVRDSYCLEISRCDNNSATRYVRP
jgi:hypothetical protein